VTSTHEALQQGLNHQQAGRLDEAEQIYRQVLQTEPQNTQAMYLLGVVAHHTGRHQEAVDLFADVIAIHPGEPRFHNALGEAHRGLGNLDEAEACYRLALDMKPDLGDAHNNLGVVLKAKGKFAEALACYRRALVLMPDSAEVHNNLGNALLELNQLDEAEEALRQALSRKPDYADAYSNLGIVFMRRDELDEATAHFCRALEINPRHSEAHNSLGNTRARQGRLEESLDCFRRALQIQPDHAAAHTDLGFALLRAGRLKEGWAEYEWRLKTDKYAGLDSAGPRWDGSPLGGETILLRSEQGLGDTLQFIRYAPLVKERGGYVVCQCPKPLLKLLRSAPGVDRLLTLGDPLPAVDAEISLMSLPRVLDTQLENIPASVPYIEADGHLVEVWRERLDCLKGLKVGIAWQGNAEQSNDRHRSIPLAAFAVLAKLAGVCLISLQKGQGLEQLRELGTGFAVVEWTNQLDEANGPFMDTAAVMKSLDLVVTADTVTAHLAGALGVPVWVALSHVADWRWLLDRSDSPWYPTMRLFRQETPGDWNGVFDRMAREIRLMGEA
jgi:tetratricopeptide (TPR) repeat protein